MDVGGYVLSQVLYVMRWCWDYQMAKLSLTVTVSHRVLVSRRSGLQTVNAGHQGQ